MSPRVSTPICRVCLHATDTAAVVGIVYKSTVTSIRSRMSDMCRIPGPAAWPFMILLYIAVGVVPNRSFTIGHYCSGSV